MSKVVSLSKTLYPLLSTGSIQEDKSPHDWKIADWDVKYQNKLWVNTLYVVLYMLCFASFLKFVVSWFFFSNPTFLREKNQEFYQGLKQFRSRSGGTSWEAWYESKLFTIVISLMIKVAPGRKRVTVKPVLRGHSKIDKTRILMTNGSLMKIKSSSIRTTSSHNSSADQLPVHRAFSTPLLLSQV